MRDVTYRYNVMCVDTVSTFARVTGRYNNNCRDVYLAVLNGEKKAVKSELDNMERMLDVEGGGRNIIYRKVSILPGIQKPEDIEYYQGCYELWTKSGQTILEIKATKENNGLSNRLGCALRDVVESYATTKAGMSASIKKNFAIKLMFWMDEIFKDSLLQWTDNSGIKVVADGVSKSTEAYFYYMLTRIGADVIIHPLDGTKLPQIIEQNANVIEAKYIKPVKEVQPELPVSTRQEEHKPKPVNIVHTQRAAIPSKCEKSFEELARLAKSIVMIAVHNENGDIIGSGSGIMVGKKGFILTNNHVISKGAFFSVRIENDDNAYPTDEIIKYNPAADMAVIRIDRELEPIPMYKGEKELVRGQKVVAIGSPLGLFNSVSDGIISGFRKINDVDMIQFTAPTSHGSSGGALLNMYGEVIGMSSAGFDDGQNINLAVTYDDINPFIRGFI